MFIHLFFVIQGLLRLDFGNPMYSSSFISFTAHFSRF